MGMNPRLLRPTASGFDPLSISSLSLWLDATDTGSTVLDQGVTTWRDKSGNGRDFSQGTGNNQPTIGTLNGRRALSFNGTSAQMTRDIVHADICDASGAASFVVFQPSSDSIYSVLHIGVTLGGHRDRFSDGNSYTGIFRSPRLNGFLNGKMPTNTAAILTHHVVQPGNHIIRINRIEERSDALAAGSSTFISWRGAGNHTSRIGVGAEEADFFVGVIGEILIYGRGLTAAEVVRVENYLAGKWGIA
jgi:hypothetical protein